MSASDSGYAKLSAPTGISASDGTYSNRVELIWTSVEGAIGYQVYRSETAYVSNATGISATTDPGYADEGITPGKQYFYWVGATAAVGSSELSVSDSGYAGLLAPTGISVSKGAYPNNIRVTWNESTGATKYKVYRNTVSNSGSATDISGELTGAAFDDTCATPGLVYYYWIKAGTEITWSDFSISDSGYALFIVSDETVWKYKDSKKADVLKGTGIAPSFTPNLIVGWQIGLATKTEEGTLTNFSGPFKLENLRNKNKVWLLKRKKELIIKYKAKKDSLTYKLWDQMPVSKVVYLVNPATGNTQLIGDSGGNDHIMGLELKATESSGTTGWQILVPVIFVEE